MTLSSAATEVSWRPTFPVGYRSFHPDPSINYELNRWHGVLPGAELEAAAPRIASHGDWKAVMLELAEGAERRGRTRAAAFYYRAAEFFMDFADPDKIGAYRRFVELFDRVAAAVPHRRRQVPYGGGLLPVIELDAAAVRAAAGEPGPGRSAGGPVLLHGGFDSLMEELFDWALYFALAGQDVVLFEGPGQGAPLRDHGLTMAPEWERPVAAVLDHLAIDRATIVGISLGGYLAPRAAAFEPRIEAVVACDVLDDFYDCFAARASEAAVTLLGRLLDGGARTEANAVLDRVMAESPPTAWAIRHGMHVSGAGDPYEFLLWLRAMSTASFSDRITADVLLLAGAADHIVPLHQLWRQASRLASARSVTCRLFTAAEQAHQHCQIGNVGLALSFVRSWLDFRGAGVA